MDLQYYKAASERTDADERALIPAIRHTNKAQPQHSPLPTWTDQARNAIRQGQNLNEFVLHCHPDNRNEARKAYLRLSIEHVRAHADKLAEVLREAITDEGAMAYKSHALALVRLKSINATVREAIAAYEAAQ